MYMSRVHWCFVIRKKCCWGAEWGMRPTLFHPVVTIVLSSKCAHVDRRRSSDMAWITDEYLKYLIAILSRRGRGRHWTRFSMTPADNSRIPSAPFGMRINRSAECSPFTWRRKQRQTEHGREELALPLQPGQCPTLSQWNLYSSFWDIKHDRYYHFPNNFWLKNKPRYVLFYYNIFLLILVQACVFNVPTGYSRIKEHTTVFFLKLVVVNLGMVFYKGNPNQCGLEGASACAESGTVAEPPPGLFNPKSSAADDHRIAADLRRIIRGPTLQVGTDFADGASGIRIIPRAPQRHRRSLPTVARFSPNHAEYLRLFFLVLVRERNGRVASSQHRSLAAVAALSTYKVGVE